jgi:hypothetical protein
MSNVILATKRTATDILNSVTVTTGALNHGITAVANLAEAGSSVAGDYRDQVVANSAARKERYNHSSALNDAHFYLGLQNEIGDNAELEKLYQQSLALRKGNTAQPTPIAAV